MNYQSKEKYDHTEKHVTSNEKIQAELNARENVIPENEHSPEYFYSQINKNIEKELTHEQKKAVKSVLARAVRKPTKKIIDFRTTFWFIKKLDILVFIGIHKDKKVGSDEYKDKMSVIRFGLKTIVYSIEVLVVILLLFLTLYMLKSFLGIDLFPEIHLSDIFK